jgi:hypothetical protein
MYLFTTDFWLCPVTVTGKTIIRTAANKEIRSFFIVLIFSKERPHICQYKIKIAESLKQAPEW